MLAESCVTWAPLRAVAWIGVWLWVGCGGAAGGTASRHASGAAANNAGDAAPSPGRAASNPVTPLVMLQPSAAGAPSSGGFDGCAPGTYSGTYDLGLLGVGPITFELVPGEPASTAPCEEFCPDLVLSSEGGEFFASWLGFEGKAGLKGGLDCSTGEFRGEMVDGSFGINTSGDPDAPLDGGALEGTFTGRFDSAGAARIAGDIACSVGFDLEGTFDVTRSP
ncbi:MAG: hypothetical protein ABW321_17170 [Polyangiales bacterium]